MIATLTAEEVSPKLLGLYSLMATGKGSGGASDNEMPNFCAYNFPAVVLTVGQEVTQSPESYTLNPEPGIAFQPKFWARDVT